MLSLWPVPHSSMHHPERRSGIYHSGPRLLGRSLYRFFMIIIHSRTSVHASTRSARTGRFFSLARPYPAHPEPVEGRAIAVSKLIYDFSLEIASNLTKSAKAIS